VLLVPRHEATPYVLVVVVEQVDGLQLGLCLVLIFDFENRRLLVFFLFVSLLLFFDKINNIEA